MPYVLEVQKFHISGTEYNGKSEHIGYMNKVFLSKQETCDYYNKFNSHMRSLTASESWCSDCDPNTGLIYIVREHFYEYLDLPPFEAS